METIALTKPDMAVVRAQITGDRPLGMQTDTFVQSIFARIRAGRGAYGLFSLEYLLEEGAAAEVAAPIHEYHLHFDVQARQDEKGVFAVPHVVRVAQHGHPEKIVLARQSIHQVFSRLHMAAHAAPGRSGGWQARPRPGQAPTLAGKHAPGEETTLNGQKQPGYRQPWRPLYTGVQRDVQPADVSGIAADGSSVETSKQVQLQNRIASHEAVRILHTVRETTMRAERASFTGIVQMPIEREMLQAALRQSNALRRRGLAYQAEQPFAPFRIAEAVHTQATDATAGDMAEADTTPVAREHLPDAVGIAPTPAVLVHKEALPREAWDEAAAAHPPNIPSAPQKAQYMARRGTQPEAEGAGLQMPGRKASSELVHSTEEATAEHRGVQGMLHRLGLRGNTKHAATLHAQQSQAAEGVRGRHEHAQQGRVAEGVQGKRDLHQGQTGTAPPMGIPVAAKPAMDHVAGYGTAPPRDTGMPAAAGAANVTAVQARGYAEGQQPGQQQPGQRIMEHTQGAGFEPPILAHPMDAARLPGENAAQQPVFTAQQAKRYEQAQAQAKGELRLRRESAAHAGTQWQPRHSQAAKTAMNKAQAYAPSTLEYTLGQQQARLEPDGMLAELPEWAQAYMAHAQRAQTPQAAGTAAQASATQPEATDASIVKRMAISKPNMTKPLAAPVQQMMWTAPGYAAQKPPQMAHREKRPEAAAPQPKPLRISDAEINRMANKIYGILEDKLRVESRRMGY